VPRILIADDTPAVRAVCRAVLEGDGHEVFEAPDGAEALALFSLHRPALVLCDLLMPGRGGLETLRWLRAFSDVPVVVMSGQGERLDGARLFPAAYGLGAAAALRKPFTVDELLFVVRQVLAGAGK